MTNHDAERDWEQGCCNGSPDCANNRIKKFCDDLFELAKTNIWKARDVLGDYMESVETDRDFSKLKRREAVDELAASKKEIERLRGAFKNYGRHGNKITGIMCEQERHSKYNCNCGFDEALAEGKKE